MSVREYIGARYVPLFADPLTWDATRTYEPLTVVLYQGNSYTSRQAVPANIDISNTTYWAQTGNYNAQIEQYRAEVQTFDSRITANATAISTEQTARQNADSNLSTQINTESSARQSADTALQQSITANAAAISSEETARQSADTALQQSITANATAISNETTARQSADNALGARIDALANEKGIVLLFGDSYCVTGVGDGRGNIYEQLVARIGNKYTIKNYSVGGAAFADVENPEAPYILTQANQAIADTSFDHTKVDFCVVVGGRNDGYRGTLAQSVNGVSAVGTALRNEFQCKVVFAIGNWTGQKLTANANTKFLDMEGMAKSIAGCVSTSGLWSALLTGDDSLAPESTNYHPIPSGMWRITNLIISAMFGGSSEFTKRIVLDNPFSGCAQMVVRIHGNLVNYEFTLSSNSSMTSPVALSNAANRFFAAGNRYMTANSVNAGNAPCTLRFNADGTVQSFPAGSTVVNSVPFNHTLTLV